MTQAAEKYKGVPYRYGGHSADGLDCSGLVYLVFRDVLDVTVPRTVKNLYTWTEPIRDEKLQPGDLVFFNTTGSVSHVGIYLGEGRFIHSASEGPKTGVIYSSLHEDYWQRTYIGAGRALTSADYLGLFLGIAAAPSWNTYNSSFADPLRGSAFQIRAAYDIPIAKRYLRVGLELRPEWDGSLGVFRMPVTLSAGLSDTFRFFIGPAFTIGDPVLESGGESRSYKGGNSWLGAIGVTWAPLTIRAADGKLSLFAEFAWQSYFPESGQEDNWSADFAAGFRVSTGLRYTWEL
ncbi:C40 family peptidase [Breznakiella homolactica]|uniref:C40 family peptidase n=1 Tax=Breznakiella homolactica TaxID=2798577 RepID=UPI001CBA5F8B|nr:C40 family peptidase [Breznakiella homolactica]